MFPIYFFGIGIILAIIQIFVFNTAVIESLLLSIIISSIGLNGLFAFIGHFFKSDDVARSIGWPTGNPFQKEIAFTNLSFGILGILSIWFHGNFWLATIISSSIFTLGAAFTHIKDIKENENKHKYNAGAILYFDILIPVVLMGLYILNTTVS